MTNNMEGIDEPILRKNSFEISYQSLAQVLAVNRMVTIVVAGVLVTFSNTEIIEAIDVNSARDWWDEVLAFEWAIWK